MSRRVYIYVQDALPKRNEAGSPGRIYSNVRAYLDLGFDVEVVYVQTRQDHPLVTEPSLEGVTWVGLPSEPTGRSPLDLIAYLVGWPIRPMFTYLFPERDCVKQAVRERVASSPEAIHHFEYLATASAITGLPMINSVWSFHDFESNYQDWSRRIRLTVDGIPYERHHARAAMRTRQAEKLVAKQAQLILCIATHEQQLLRQEWGCSNAEYFPMSIPVEDVPQRTRSWAENDRLRLLHVGRIDALPSFSSLWFLLNEVFPLVPDTDLQKIELIVVGKINENRRSAKLLDLASRYPQVHFVGYQEDLREVYSTADLQLVGSTEATGARTRTIESFAYEVPVLSTRVGAEGLEGLCDGTNILLADSAQAYAERILYLLHNPERLPLLARQARWTYSQLYSRAAVAERLSSILGRYFKLATAPRAAG